jgi:hypothetical protein
MWEESPMSNKLTQMLRLAPPSPPDPFEEETMLRSFLSELEVRAKLVEPRIAGDKVKEDILTEVRTALSTFFDGTSARGRCAVEDAWNRAYRLERMMALAEPDDTLVAEVQRRIEEASEEKVPTAARLRTTFETAQQTLIDATATPPVLKAGAVDRLRAMLLDVLEETHWAVQRKFHSRPIQKSATRRLVGMGLAACAVFVLPFAYLYVSIVLKGNEFAPPFKHWSWLPLWSAMTAGFFGAMFSRLLSLQANWNALSIGALKDARDYSSILLRGAVGMTGAVVVYYFLLAGVVSGSMFPAFEKMDLSHFPAAAGAAAPVAAGPAAPAAAAGAAMPLGLILPNAQLALLVVWSFLAGFSERLVPSILQSTETSLRDTPKDRK